MKKQFKSITIVLSLMFFVFGISSVFSSWTYYEGPVEPTSVEISNIELGEFDYEPPRPLLPNFEDTPSGHKNSTTIDKIIDSNTGVNNVSAPINTILQKKLPESGFVTSVDTISSTSEGYPVLSGEDIKNELGISTSSHFLIYLDQKDFLDQTWFVYTTDYPFEKLKQIENLEDPNTPKFNHEYIYDVYRSKMKWHAEWGFEDEAIYTLVENETTIGYATPTINEINNPNQPFFNPSTFVEGKYVPIDSLSIEGPTTVYTNELIQYNAIFEPIDTTNQSVEWSSSNNKVARIDQNGILTPVSVGEVTIYAKSVYKNIPIAEFTINIAQQGENNPTSIEIKGPLYGNVVSGREYQLEAKIYPETVGNKNVIWSTSDENVATISEDGILTIKELKGTTSFTVYAKSVMNNEIISSQNYIVQLPNADSSINGRYEIQNGKLVYFNAKEVSLDEIGCVYPAGTTNQAIKVKLSKGDIQNNVELIFNSDDPNASIVSVFAMNENNEIQEYYSENGLILRNNQYTDMTYFITFSGNKPIEYQFKK